jgi:hypothetical protein
MHLLLLLLCTNYALIIDLLELCTYITIIIIIIIIIIHFIIMMMMHLLL